jgi:tRNA dimethylallyltransferase
MKNSSFKNPSKQMSKQLESLPLLVIAGPTASGKTKIAIETAKKINAEIICADSRAIYKGFDIASAKPAPDEQNGVVHHLLDILEPTVQFSAGDFVTAAREAIHDIRTRQKNVVIVGGTWFYIKSLLDEKELPEIPKNESLREELHAKTPDELWETLLSLDPKRAELVHKNNVDKVIRSIEMCKCLNGPITEYERPENAHYDALWFAPNLTREELYERINKRVDIMLETGLEAEFRSIMEKYGENPASYSIISNTIGYKEFLEFSHEGHKKIAEKIKQHTRNFAKRQLTWLRGNTQIKPIESSEALFDQVAHLL